ncbi:hypothetical protein H6P81_002272 [Aristolochia fimbriata]|uniref:J domain-containing protein n=1 Tax=Aristolochia fimbriata TaxID=158543 RepID=A0AAV7FB34_ARIFI|nr:hypothetical protein H6P81_002272 [Aristolochia fimbriata]
MARKANQQKKDKGHKGKVSEQEDNAFLSEKKDKGHKGKVSEQEDYGSSYVETLGKAKYWQEGQRMNQRSTCSSHDGNSKNCVGNDSAFDASEFRGNGPANGLSPEFVMGRLRPNVLAGWSLGSSALSVLKVAAEWFEKQKPLFDAVLTVLASGHDYVRLKVDRFYPIIWPWVVHFGKLVLLLSLVWFDCSIRGLDSLLRLGTTSFFTVIWCSILSMMAMIGFFKFLIMLVIAALVALFIGVMHSIAFTATFATVCLWIYGSFWTTGPVIIVAGVAFGLSYERVTLLIATLYSLYCVVGYIGWWGLLLGINLSFISSDLLIHFLKDNINETRRTSFPERPEQTGGRPGNAFPGEHSDSFRTTSGGFMDRDTGIPSTSGTEAETTSEDEVLRLLSCSDHYTALGLSRFQNIDAAFLKREYRKKAMLVHPDKNMGNEKAAEAFKKLQNAYEILLDSVKRKTYDDELRKEELLNYFLRFQNATQQSQRPGFSATAFTHSEVDDGDLFGASRRIACKKCKQFHVWVLVERFKARARWCQECKDFHQAKDGDGWVEQSSHPLLFGLLQKADAPSAYVCSDSRIYDATAWYVCQGMRCPANTHKPTFHVNASIVSKQTNKASASASHKGGPGPGPGQGPGPGPGLNMDEPMTEEEFYEWLQNAVQSGMFETSNNHPSESTSARSASGSKGTSSKKKRKGKKQW